MAAKVSLKDLAVFRAIENRSPGFELANAVRRFLCMQLGHAPVVNILSAAHRVGKMHLPIVAVIDVRKRRGHSPLGHHGVRLAKQRFTDQPDLNARRRCLDRSTQTSTTGTYDEYVVFKCCVFNNQGMRTPSSANAACGVKFFSCFALMVDGGVRVPSKDPVVRDQSHRTRPNIKICKSDPEKREPREHHMSAVQLTDPTPKAVLHRFV